MTPYLLLSRHCFLLLFYTLLLVVGCTNGRCVWTVGRLVGLYFLSCCHMEVFQRSETLQREEGENVSEKSKQKLCVMRKIWIRNIELEKGEEF